jgi:hypothetical protein
MKIKQLIKRVAPPILVDASRALRDRYGKKHRRLRGRDPVGRNDLTSDIDEAARRVYAEVGPYTMSGIERVASLCQAVEYVVRSCIPGDIVECGVWKGGSMMAIAKTLLRVGAPDRRLHLFDTFEGMTPPTAADVNLRGQEAAVLLAGAGAAKASANIWAIAPLKAVRDAMEGTGYNPQAINYVQGRVEDTLPAHVPSQIALLRLDTDWYESTYHEMVHLYPRLSVGGVLIIDDYGHWQGARRAIDQYVAEKKLRLLLTRVDYTCRVAVKLEI